MRWQPQFNIVLWRSSLHFSANSPPLYLLVAELSTPSLLAYYRIYPFNFSSHSFPPEVAFHLLRCPPLLPVLAINPFPFPLLIPTSPLTQLTTSYSYHSSPFNALPLRGSLLSLFLLPFSVVFLHPPSLLTRPPFKYLPL